MWDDIKNIFFSVFIEVQSCAVQENFFLRSNFSYTLTFFFIFTPLVSFDGFINTPGLQCIILTVVVGLSLYDHLRTPIELKTESCAPTCILQLASRADVFKWEYPLKCIRIYGRTKFPFSLLSSTGHVSQYLA